jgi:N-formylglutamate deformylase
MSPSQPYTLSEPEPLTTAAVFNSPHSGRDYPERLLEQTRLDHLALRASEDVLVDQLYAPAPDFGAPLLAATLPRAWLDLNRGPTELDPSLVSGARSPGLNQRIAAGLGVVPRIVAEGKAIYDGKISLTDAKARVRDVHEPYHARLESLLLRARRMFGYAILFDCHSMPSEALRAAPRVNRQVPQIVLGDRFGAAAPRQIVSATQEAFEAEGFVVARNAPFAGGYITQRYGRPARGLNAVQIEIDRGLYLDQKSLERKPEFNEISDRLQSVISRLVTITPQTQALAAE